MANSEIIQSIRNEIERLVDEYKPTVGGVDELTGAHIVLAKLHSFLSTLEPEKPMNKDCNGCPHCVDRKDQYGWHFKGCFGGPYNGKFIAEIDECPLKQEQPEDCLVEEVKRYYSDNFEYLSSDQPTLSILTNVARHFAKWQIEQDEKEQADLFTIVALDAAQRAKEQILKDAVEGEFLYTPYPTISLDDWEDYNFTDFDKVRVIVLPKDD